MTDATSLLSALQTVAEDLGAHQTGIIPTDQLKVWPEVRQMCEKNTCRGHGKTWACPPGVGPIEDCLARVKRYDTMLLFSVKYALEDSFDYEGMMEGMKAFRAFSSAFDEAIRPLLSYYLLLANEGCDHCSTCSYPNAPCRFPTRMHSSLEAYGFMVNELCSQAGIRYINGQNTVTYFGGLCFNQRD